MIVQVRVVFKKTVVGDWCFDHLSSSHLQCQALALLDALDFEDDYRSGSQNVSHQQTTLTRMITLNKQHYLLCTVGAV